MRIKSVSLAMLATASILSSTADADLVDRWSVGSGDQTASLQFDFLDGNTFVFDVSWTGDLTGREAFDLIDADSTGRFDFEFEVISFSFGDFLVGVGVEDAYDYGEGTPPDYVDVWTYWNSDSASDDWTYSSVGFSARMLTDGARDGWVFGSTDAPAVIPAPGLIPAALVAGLLRRRRRS